MPEDEPIIAHGNEVFRIEVRGFDHIPESERNMSLRQVDDIWVGKTSVLFELIGARYERRSMLVTANQPFAEWGRVFPDPAMTLAAVDRLVHHSTIFEMNVDSYRRRTALQRKQQGAGRPPAYATIKNVGPLSPSDNQTPT